MSTQDNTRLTLTHLIAGALNPADIADDQWDLLAPAALADGLAPMLIHVLHQHDSTLLQLPIFRPLLADAQLVTYHVAQLQAVQEKIESVLTARGITRIWLKGIALAQTVYPAPNLRSMSDLDFFIPYECRSDALTALKDAGFRSIDSHEPAAELLAAQHHDRLMDVYSRGFIEMHYRLFGGDVLADAAEAWFRRQVYVTPHGWAALTPEAQLLHLCIHHVLVDFDQKLRLVRYFDIHLLVSAGTLNWEVILRTAERFGWSNALAYALEKVSYWFGTPIPAHISAQLEAQTDGRRLTPGKLARGADAAGADAALHLLQASSPTERRALLRWFLLPPGDYLRCRYPDYAYLPIWALYPLRWSLQAIKLARLLLTRFTL
ncbi:MAG: nucleotidyltransferase family protein [Anaerolinea sp.]|nr:nucleotidyltransferase family protein [Anaerolinea sp.]